MPTEITVSLISVSSVVLSAAVSVAISLRVSKTEVRKLHHDMSKTYARHLIEKRMEVYPEMFELCSTFIKRIRFGALDKAAIDEFWTKFQLMDSRKSLFYSEGTSARVHEFNKFIGEYLSKVVDEQLADLVKTGDDRKKLIKHFWEVELALRNDIGIYVSDQFLPPGNSTRSVDVILNRTSNPVPTGHVLPL